MRIDEQQHGAVTVLRPTGSLTSEHADAFRGAVANALARSLGRLVIDAGALSHVDSAGLEAMVESAQRLGESGLGFKLCELNETMRETLDLTETSELFEQYADLNSAVRSFM